MVEYFCGARPSPVARRLLQAAVALVLFCVVASLSASAQNRTGRSNSPQAGLHIEVNVVPVLFAPPPPKETQRPLLNSVTYNISTTKSNVEVTEETRPLAPSNSGGVGSQGGILRTATAALIDLAHGRTSL